MPRPKPLVLVIIDAFGVSLQKEGNPVYAARHPVLQAIERWYPFTTLQASGLAVGLPVREAGNSEVGHLTMGAGRILHHHLPRIISSIRDRSFMKNEVLLAAVAHAKKGRGRVHIAGLISSGSVHSYADHLYALLDMLAQEEVPEVYIHAFTDGKDAPPKEGAAFLRRLEAQCVTDWPIAHLASVVGRFWAMDRDEKWDRTRRAYELLADGKGVSVSSAEEYLERAYVGGMSDEFIEPAMVAGPDGAPLPHVEAGDALIFLNFREDSMRQIAHAFADDQFDKFPRNRIENLAIATMTEYDEMLSPLAAFPSPLVAYPLAEVLSREGLTHLHIAETEKYAHVTYFFNGGRERPFDGEERILIPSSAVAHFDEEPEMRAREIADAIIEHAGEFDVIIANFANADMVGHSGNFNATVRAVEIVDECLGRIKTAIDRAGGAMVITGDHGGVEMKRNMISGEMRTEHSINPVPLYLVGEAWRRTTKRTPEEIEKLEKQIGGILTDIAPTILDILELKKPPEMSGASLLSALLRQMERPDDATI